MGTARDPIENLIQQARLVGANAAHGATRRAEVAAKAERAGDESARLCALAFVEMYQSQQEGAERLVERLQRIRSARARYLVRAASQTSTGIDETPDERASHTDAPSTATE